MESVIYSCVGGWVSERGTHVAEDGAVNVSAVCEDAEDCLEDF